MQNTSQSLVGIVVIGRNEGSRLEKALSSISKQAHPIVYVDSGSTDGSPAKAEHYGAFVTILDSESMFTAARARNAGLEALLQLRADLQFVQFIDGDCELLDGWVAAGTLVLQSNPDVAIVCGRRRELHPERSIYNRLCDIEWNTPLGESNSCGGDMIARVPALVAVGGFRSSLVSGEEPELCARLRERGWRILRVDKDMTLHDANITVFRQWWGRSVRSGYGYANLTWLQGTRSIYKRELARAIIWGAGLPLVAGLAATLANAMFVLLFVLYPLQIIKIAGRNGIRRKESWAYASLMMISKFAEVWGVFKFLFTKSRRTSEFDYKMRVPRLFGKPSVSNPPCQK